MCIFKNLNKIFGEPGIGLHSIRIINIAVVDVDLTILFSYIISKKYKLNFKKTLLNMFLLGIISHEIFCVKTTINKLLFK
jgi:hypothetical protein